MPVSMMNRAILSLAPVKASAYATDWHWMAKKQVVTLTSKLSSLFRGKNGPLGYLRLTLDTHTLPTEAKQVDNTTNILRLMLLLSLATGVVLTRTLLQGKRTRWQQSPFLLTASKPVPEEEEREKKRVNSP
ncbi:membrane protein [Salmonella bongori]|nr:membrane protein [Salmonella bongori]